MTSDDHFIPPHGGYEQLLSYQKALIIFQGTRFFVRKWLPARGDRTVDQMVQAARSGKQNIVEGSMASATSKEMEIKLTNVAKASFEELREDYADFFAGSWSGRVACGAPLCTQIQGIESEAGSGVCGFSERH